MVLNQSLSHSPYAPGTQEEQADCFPEFHCPMRILHAPENIGGMAGVMAKAQAALGHDARSFCARSNHFNFSTDYTLNNPDSRNELLTMSIKLAARFDVFHFYFGSSLLGASLLDVLPLSLLGKKIFFYFCGCDIRDEKHTIQNYAISACANCFPKLCSRNREKAKAVAERYGRVNFVSTPDLLEFLPRSVLLPQVVDFDLVDSLLADEPPPPRDPERFVIAHAPTNRQIKGTPYLLEAVERLKAQGYRIELLLIENLSHATALRKYRQADLAVDQLLIGSYGLLAAELMALGVPTAAYLRADVLKHYPEHPPLLNTNPQRLEATLKQCYENRDDLKNFIEPGRRFARAVHHPKLLAQQCLEYYS